MFVYGKLLLTIIFIQYFSIYHTNTHHINK